MRKTSASLALVFFIFLTIAISLSAQNDGTIHLPPTISHSPSMGDIPVRSSDDAQKEQLKKAEQLREEEIRRDTGKLLQLSTELKDSIDKTGQGLFSVDAVKKAEQIEKLAHSVKSKLKQSY